MTSMEQAFVSDPDHQLIRRTLQGDLSAFEELVRKYQRPLLSLCRSFIDNRADAQDVSQEIFLQAFTGLKNFRYQASFRTWIYRIAVNACLKFKHQRKEFVALSARPADPASAGVDIVERAEQRRLVRAHVQQLPKKQRAAIVLRLEHELSYEEIAEITGQTASTVKITVFYALQNIKKRMEASSRMAGRRLKLKPAKSD